MRKKLFYVLIDTFLITFIVELILGFNGRLLMLGNIPIRQILFGLVLLVLVIKVFIVIKDNNLNKRGDDQYE